MRPGVGDKQQDLYARSGCKKSSSLRNGKEQMDVDNRTKGKQKTDMDV